MIYDVYFYFLRARCDNLNYFYRQISLCISDFYRYDEFPVHVFIMK